MSCAQCMTDDPAVAMANMVTFSPSRLIVTFAQFCLCRTGRICADRFHEVMCSPDGCLEGLNCWCECHTYTRVRACRRRTPVSIRDGLGHSTVLSYAFLAEWIRMVTPLMSAGPVGTWEPLLR